MLLLASPYQSGGVAATRIQMSVSPSLCAAGNRMISTWNDKSVRVCDPSVCAGGASMASAMTLPSKGAARLAEAQMQTFLDTVQAVDGWMDPEHVLYIQALTQLQHADGLYGPVAEIGVHAGKFWLPIAGYAHASEPLVAIDLFQDQHKNFDKSGGGPGGTKSKFLEAAHQALGLHEHDIHVFSDSSTLHARDFSALGLSRFRLLSIDGGHALESSLRDLTLAACVLAEGGIMVLDDVATPLPGEFPWLGVPTALFNWIPEQRRVAPFLWAAHKLYLTTTSHHAKYLSAVHKWDEVVTCAKDVHASRISIGQFPLCFSVRKEKLTFTELRKLMPAAI